MPSETRKRTELIVVRLLPDERSAMERAAETSECGVSTWAREALTRAAKRKVPPRRRRTNIDAKLLADVVGQLGRIGSNVNQVAKVANAMGTIDPAMFADALTELRAIRAAVLSPPEGET